MKQKICIFYCVFLYPAGKKKIPEKRKKLPDSTNLVKPKGIIFSCLKNIKV